MNNLGLGETVIIVVVIICVTVLILWFTDNKRKLSASDMVEIRKAEAAAYKEVSQQTTTPKTE